MEKYLALIKNGVIENIVIGDDSFIEHIQPQYDAVIDVTHGARPHCGDSYYPDSKSFISNQSHHHDLAVDYDKEHLQKGTKDSFEPFAISQYSVKYKNGFVLIGCKRYPAAPLLDALHRGLKRRERGTVSCFYATESGPTHGKFDITWDDAQKLHDALIQIKFPRRHKWRLRKLWSMLKFWQD